LPDAAAPALSASDTTPPRRTRIVPRNAASLILVRQSRARGVELLMGMRGSKHVFMPNVLVFPGGRVDPHDHRAPYATPLRADTQALLERTATPRQAYGIALAAARELEEETGLTLARTLGAPPALDGLEYLCRAVTPPNNNRRFNARFLVAEAGHARGTLAGSGELEQLAWYTLEDVLSHRLASITREVVGNLERFLAMSPEQRRERRETPLNQRNVWRME